MGLGIGIHRFTEKTGKDTYHSGYGGFLFYRKEVAHAFSPRLGELYDEWCNIFVGIKNQKDVEEFWGLLNNNEAMKLFLTHSDCDGDFSVKECRMLHDEMLKLVPKFENSLRKETHDLWVEMFEFCYKNRVKMFFY